MAEQEVYNADEVKKVEEEKVETEAVGSSDGSYELIDFENPEGNAFDEVDAKEVEDIAVPKRKKSGILGLRLSTRKKKKKSAKAEETADSEKSASNLELNDVKADEPEDQEKTEKAEEKCDKTAKKNKKSAVKKEITDTNKNDSNVEINDKVDEIEENANEQEEKSDQTTEEEQLEQTKKEEQKTAQPEVNEVEKTDGKKKKPGRLRRLSFSKIKKSKKQGKKENKDETENENKDGDEEKTPEITVQNVQEKREQPEATDQSEDEKEISEPITSDIEIIRKQGEKHGELSRNDEDLENECDDGTYRSYLLTVAHMPGDIAVKAIQTIKQVFKPVIIYIIRKNPHCFREVIENSKKNACCPTQL